MKTKWKRITEGLAVICLALFACVFLNTDKAWASEQYTQMFAQYSWASEKQEIDYGWLGETVKIGDYYFKGDLEESPDDVAVTVIYISDKEDSGFQKVPIELYSYFALTNGEEAYYVKYNEEYTSQSLCKFVFDTKEESAVIELSDQYYWYTTAAYNGKIYLTRQDSHGDTTYAYDIKSAEFTKIIDNFNIRDFSGKYVITYGKWIGESMPLYANLTLWELTETGAKKERVLCKNVSDAQFLNGKLYYAVYKNKKMNVMTLYRCNADGSQIEQLAKIDFSSKKKSKKYGTINVESVSPKQCLIYTDRGEYTYTYATKKLKKRGY